MALSLQQVMRQTQKLIMTPQMQQSIQLLQLNSLELEQMIHTEMMENPFLEVSDDEEGLKTEEPDAGAETSPELLADDAPVGLSEQTSAEATPSDESVIPDFIEPRQPTASESDAETADPAGEASEFESFGQNDVDWAEQYNDSDTSSYASTREDMEEHDFTTYTPLRVSLYDSLVRQLRLSSLEGKDFKIGEYIIGNLNESGFLDSSPENMAQVLGYPPDLIAVKGAPNSEARLRRMLVKFKGDADIQHFAQLNRRQLVATLVAALTGLTPDEAMAMSRHEWLLLLVARRLERPYEEVAQTSHEDLILECIAKRMKTDAQNVFDVLEVIQDFEPTGVGARNLGECLRLQCEENGYRNRILYKVLDDHLPDLQQKRFREIARALDCTEEQVMEVFHIISHLDPRPGQTQTKDSPRYITPDVYVKKVDEKYMYFLNEGDAGRLRIAGNYRRLLVDRSRKAQAAAAEQHAAANNGQAQAPEILGAANEQAQYAHEKYKSAIWLIKNIEKRKSTVLRVTEAIMNYQKEFLDKGIEHLRPLTLRNIAEVVGMHESTIARVTTGKYVETPRGIFELKFFFSSGLETETGEDASSRSIKEMITQMIEAEDLRKPLSDQKIADMLKDKGIQIARRTVAKYREQLKILPAKLRKSVG